MIFQAANHVSLVIIGADEVCEVLIGHIGAARTSITVAGFSGIQLLNAMEEE